MNRVQQEGSRLTAVWRDATEQSDAVLTVQSHSGLRERKEAGWFCQSPGEQSESESRSVVSLCNPMEFSRPEYWSG